MKKMLTFTTWIDADSCPSTLRDYIIQTAVKNSFIVSMVANREILQNSDNVKMIICEKTQNAADNYIFENVKKNDIVITRDIPFAARLVEKGIFVMNDRGLSFTKDNIEDRLMERNLSLNLSEIGFSGNKKKQYSQKEIKKFASAFEYELQKHITNEIYAIKK